MEDSHAEIEARVAAISRRINAEPRHKLVLYRILEWCGEPRFIEELDEEVGSWPEMKASPFSVRTMVSWLVDVDALEELTPRQVAVLAGEVDPEEELPAALDATPQGETDAAEDADQDGEPQPEEEHTGVLQITEAGIAALRDHENEDGLGVLLDASSSYAPYYLRVLEACRTPQSRPDVERLFAGDPFLENPKVYPSVFLDRLEQAGALQWDDGWLTTEKGRARIA